MDFFYTKIENSGPATARIGIKGHAPLSQFLNSSFILQFRIEFSLLFILDFIHPVSVSRTFNSNSTINKIQCLSIAIVRIDNIIEYTLSIFLINLFIIQFSHFVNNTIIFSYNRTMIGITHMNRNKIKCFILKITQSNNFKFIW